MQMSVKYNSVYHVEPMCSSTHALLSWELYSAPSSH